MKVTQEVLPDSQVGLEIEIPAEMSQKTYESGFAEVYAAPPIFRAFGRGKYPGRFFLQRVGVNSLRWLYWRNWCRMPSIRRSNKKKLTPSVTNQLKSPFEELVTQYEPGEALTISAAVDVPPPRNPEAIQGVVCSGGGD